MRVRGGLVVRGERRTGCVGERRTGCEGERRIVSQITTNSTTCNLPCNIFKNV